MESEQPHKNVGRTMESDATHLPADLVSDILLRLPVKSIVKFRCVSKVWFSITTCPSFISSFAARSSPRLLIMSEKNGKRFGFSIPQNQNLDKKPQLVKCYAMTYQDNRTVFWNVSIHGMICSKISGTLEIRNPTMRRTVTLPQPKREEWSHTTTFIGFDPIDGTYKVLCIPCNYRSGGDNQPRVLTLNGDHQEPWRVIQDITEHRPCPSGHDCIINGVMYYLASPKPDFTDYIRGYILVSFHVRSEKMSIIKPPWNYLSLRKLLLVLHGKLACVSSKSRDGTNFDDIEIWILEDAEKHEWSYKYIPLPFPSYDPVSQKYYLQLSGFNDAGELIFLPPRLVDPVQILYYDPNRNSYRSVVAEGVADDQFRRNNGLGVNDVLYTSDVYSNHIETLMLF